MDTFRYVNSASITGYLVLSWKINFSCWLFFNYFLLVTNEAVCIFLVSQPISISKLFFVNWWNFFKKCFYALFFYKQRFFSTQPQCCLTFSWIELQMMVRCCLIHTSSIILRHFFIFAISRFRSIYVVSVLSIFHFHLHFHHD